MTPASPHGNDLLRFLVRIAVHCARNDTPRLRRALGLLRRKPGWRRAALEAILEVHLFAGFPATIEGLFAFDSVLPGTRKRRTRSLPPGRLRARGERLCRLVYGNRYRRLVRSMGNLHPDFSEWILEYGYGRVLARPGLSPALREMVAVAVLAAGGWERQLASHLRGALNAGAAFSDLSRALDEASRLSPGLSVPRVRAGILARSAKNP
jgi:4-carboxymuconolactone decarboxylase